jgi:N-acetylglucosamine kinase-like BadF-type ATPase
MFVLGIDAGGTKTVALLADQDGQVLAEARGPGANLQAAGELEVEKVLHLVMDEAIGDRPITPAAICLGIAGVDRDEDIAVVSAIMRRIGYKARVLVVNDALVALVAGTGSAPGIVIIAGTGSIAYGRNGTGQAARAGGWGYVLGDEGSGYWIGRLALRAVVREADGRGAATRLTPLVLRHFAVSRPQELVREVYHRQLRPPAIAALARHVQAAADEGDAIASRILELGADELTKSAESVTRQLGMSGTSFAFVLSGGIFSAVPTLARALARRLPAVARHSRTQLLDREPACGAVALALDLAHGTADVPHYIAP